ncbi:copper resistance CopC family protein [Peribacillus frigoritolerans]|uniref:copper resistance CopC family protein n=1 Tax=Peribacillus frigoritolerans TaxID=450367 RepID=UPI001059431F|nr:copper resistance CopC family protein [Peribacillus frigoritolerans]TDL80821.1 copper resistance protein CopC [Peribacillus frigoritolerans]
MKKILSLFGMLVLLILPNTAFAHTHMTSSNPEEGSTVTEPVKEIELTFDTPIESLSTMTLTRDGADVPLEVKAEGETLKGISSSELENGSYTADWKIIGEDGHEMEGTLAFTVQQEVKEEEPQPSTDDETAMNEDDQNAENDKTAQTDQQAENAESERSENSPVMTVILVAIGVIAVIGIVLLMKKKG